MSSVGPALDALPKNCTLCHPVIHHIGPDNFLVTASIRRCRKHGEPPPTYLLHPSPEASAPAASAAAAAPATADAVTPLRPPSAYTPRRNHTPYTGFNLKGSVLGALGKLHISTTPAATQRALAVAEHCERQRRARDPQCGGGSDSKENVAMTNQPQQRHRGEDLKGDTSGKPFWWEKHNQGDDGSGTNTRMESASPSPSGYEGDLDV